MTRQRSAKSKTGTGSPVKPKSADKSPKQTPPRKRRHYLPAEERREQILTTAREVFARSGLKGARTRELAQAAGINQATLFEHFKSKEELFLAAVIQPLEELVDGARERAETYATADSSADLMTMLQGAMQNNLERLTEIFPILVQALFGDRELGEKFYREQMNPLFQTRAEAVDDLINTHFEPRLVQLASFGMFFAVAMDQVIGHEQHDIEAVSRQLSELILFGCSPQPRDS